MPGKTERPSSGTTPPSASKFEWSLVQLAELDEQNGQVAVVRTSLEHSLAVLEQLAKNEPENLRWRQGLARGWETLGRVQARAGHTAKARDAAGRAVTIGEARPPRFRLHV